MAKPRRKPTPPDAVPAPVKPLTESERAEVAALDARLRRRPAVPLYEAGPDNKPMPAAAMPNRLLMARLAAALGSADASALTVLVNHALEASEGQDLVLRSNAALGLLAGIAPRDEAEGMLAVQMVAAHNMAMAMARRTLKTDRVDWMATYTNLAAKLMNVYTRQLKALARLRGQTGQQLVRVEHVTVQAGGQAIVGAVATKGRGDGEQS